MPEGGEAGAEEAKGWGWGPAKRTLGARSEEGRAADWKLAGSCCWNGPEEGRAADWKLAGSCCWPIAVPAEDLAVVTKLAGSWRSIVPPTAAGCSDGLCGAPPSYRGDDAWGARGAWRVAWGKPGREALWAGGASSSEIALRLRPTCSCVRK